MPAALCAVLAAGAEAATWREARARHFVVYAEGSELALRETAIRLEQLDAVMRLLSKRTLPDEDQAANPLTVYVVDDDSAVRRLHGSRGGNIAGFYLPRATGSVAFTPRRTGDAAFTGQLVLFHEYGHHFLLGSGAAPYPAWFSEGYAEFVSTTRFTETQAQIGRPAQHRADWLFAGGSLTAERMFGYGAKRLSEADNASLYARGWLLTHFIMFETGRAEQFNTYLDKVARGTPSAQAAREAFGDLGKLNGALNAYLARNRFDALAIDRAKLTVPDIAIRTLTPGQSAMLPLRMRSTVGVDAKTSKPIFRQAAPIAAAHLDDALVQGWFAEMASDAGELAIAEAAADRALAADPRSMQALLYKARIHLRRALDAKADVAAWREARSWIVRANKLNTNAAEPLVLYYQSFQLADAKPNAAAITGLFRVGELVPQDPALRWMTARQHLIDGEVDAAKARLRPLAYDPHAAPDNPAVRLIGLLDGGAKGRDALAALDKEQAVKADAGSAK